MGGISQPRNVDLLQALRDARDANHVPDSLLSTLMCSHEYRILRYSQRCHVIDYK
jgi:hypothetical protein